LKNGWSHVSVTLVPECADGAVLRMTSTEKICRQQIDIGVPARVGMPLGPHEKAKEGEFRPKHVVATVVREEARTGCTSEKVWLEAYRAFLRDVAMHTPTCWISLRLHPHTCTAGTAQ
jgi:hypothetical protein